MVRALFVDIKEKKLLLTFPLFFSFFLKVDPPVQNYKGSSPHFLNGLELYKPGRLIGALKNWI
jgi:hypothetical protein